MLKIGKNKYQEQETIIVYPVSGKYGILALYDIDLEAIIIDHEQLQFDKNSGWILIGNPENPDGYLLYHEYFFIRDDLFDRIQSTYQDKNIVFKFISNEPNEN